MKNKSFLDQKDTNVVAIPSEGVALFFDVVTNKFWDLVKLNLLMIVFSLAIISIPAVFSAASRIIIMMLRHEHYNLGSDFIKYFVSDFFSALIGGSVLSILIACTFFGSYQLFALYQNLSMVLLGIAIFSIVIIGAFTLANYYPLNCFVKLSVINLLKNALLLVFVDIFRTMVIFIIFMSFVCLHIFLWPYSFLFLIFISLSFTQLLFTFNAYFKIKKYIVKEDGHE